MIRSILASIGIHLALVTSALVCAFVTPSRPPAAPIGGSPTPAIISIHSMPGRTGAAPAPQIVLVSQPSVQAEPPPAQKPVAKPAPPQKAAPVRPGKIKTPNSPVITRELNIDDQPTAPANINPVIDLDDMNPSIQPSTSGASGTLGNEAQSQIAVTFASPGDGLGGAIAGVGAGYINQALFRIQQNFHPPYEMPGVTCVVQFKVQKDGKVSDMKIFKSSGRPDLDQSALKAIELTGSLAPLYDDYTKPFVTAEVTFEFVKQ